MRAHAGAIAGRITQRRIYTASLLVAAASVCVVAWLMLRAPQAPFFGDYTEWTYHGVLLRDVLQGHRDAGYVLKNYPVPNSLTTVGLGALMLLLPWQIAAKLWLLCEAALGLFAAWQLQKAASALEGWKLLVLPAAVLFGTTFWFGFSNFNFGVYFAMLVCALLLRGVESRWAYALLLLAAFFSHMIPFGFAVLVLGLYVAQRGKWKLLWQAAPSFALSAWYFAGRFGEGNADAKAGMGETIRYGTPLFALFKVNSYLKCWGFVNPALTQHDSVLLRLAGTWVFALLLIMCTVIAVGMLVMMARTAWPSLRHRGERSFFWAAVALFCVVALLMPGAAAGISDPGARMMQVAVWCGLCVVSTRRRWTAALLGVCGLGLLIADCMLVGKVAMQPAIAGETSGPMPDHLREFAHVYYMDRWQDYEYIERGDMQATIFPTAMFLKK